MQRTDQGSKATGFIRALVLTVLAVTVSGGAHVAAGGAAPGLVTTVVTITVLSVLSLPAGMARFSPARAVAALWVLQVAAHVSLTLTAMRDMARDAGLGLPGGSAHHHGAVMPIVHAPTPGSDTAGAAMASEMQRGLVPTWQMLAMHVAVALVLGIAVTLTERSWLQAAALPGGARRAAACVLPSRALRALIVLFAGVCSSATDSLSLTYSPDAPSLLRRGALWHAAPVALRGPPILRT